MADVSPSPVVKFLGAWMLNMNPLEPYFSSSPLAQFSSAATLTTLPTIKDVIPFADKSATDSRVHSSDRKLSAIRGPICLLILQRQTRPRQAHPRHPNCHESSSCRRRSTEVLGSRSLPLDSGTMWHSSNLVPRPHLQHRLRASAQSTPRSHSSSRADQ